MEPGLVVKGIVDSKFCIQIVEGILFKVWETSLKGELLEITHAFKGIRLCIFESLIKHYRLDPGRTEYPVFYLCYRGRIYYLPGQVLITKCMSSYIFHTRRKGEPIALGYNFHAKSVVTDILESTWELIAHCVIITVG